MRGPPLPFCPVRPPAEVMLNRAVVSPATMALTKRRGRAPDTSASPGHRFSPGAIGAEQCNLVP